MQSRESRLREALGLCALIIAAFTGSAAAQISSAQQSAIRSNCRSDFMSQCSGVTPGGKEALECLQKNVAKLSPGCKTAVSDTMAAPAAAAATPAKAAEPEPAKTTVKQETQPAQPAVKQEAAAPAAKQEPPKTAAKQPAAAKTVKQEPAKTAAKTEPPKSAAAAQPAKEAVEMEDVTPPREQTAFAPGAAVIAKACARSLLLHCPGQAGGGRAIACLKAYRDGGGRLGPRCDAALELQSKVAPR